MFIGHVGVALGAKRLSPDTSLGTLVLAAQWVDGVWPLFLILGVEHVRIQPGITAVTPLDFYDYPWTHSLLMGASWAVLFGAAVWLVRRRIGPALVCAGLVVSHWFLDLIVHRPDLPLYPHGPGYGLGLWNNRGATATVEAFIFCAGLMLYLKTTRPADATGRWAFAALIATVLLAYVANLQGTPPPGVGALQWTALVLAILLVVWAWWADAHRIATRLAL